MDDYLTSEEIAERYRAPSLQTVYHWRKIGYGPRGVKIGKRILYPRAEVERFDRKQAAAQNDAEQAAG